MSKKTDTNVGDAKELERLSLSKEDGAEMGALISSEKSAEELIPDDIAASQLWKYLNLSAKMIYSAQQAVSRLKPIFGRLLILLEKHPKLYQSYGYDTYDDFMSRGMATLFNISRSEAYAAKKIGKALSFLDQADLVDIGFSKASALASTLNRVISDDMSIEMIKAKRDEWVQKAQDLSLADYKLEMVSAGVIEPGETEYVALAIRVNRPTRDHWDRFTADPEIQGYCETTEQGGILEHLMQEAEGEWKARVLDAARG
jgi:hypothetical protein